MAHDDATPDAPTHTRGTTRSEDRAAPAAQRPTRMAGDATGINVADRKPIDPRMPNLPPA